MHHTSACGSAENEVSQLGKKSQRQHCFNISRIWFITEAFLQQWWVMCLEVSEVLFLQWMEVVNTQGFFYLQRGQISFQRSQTEEDSGINIMSQVLLWAVQRTPKQRFWQERQNLNNIIENEGELGEGSEILELTLRRARVKTHSISKLHLPLG